MSRLPGTADRSVRAAPKSPGGPANTVPAIPLSLLSLFEGEPFTDVQPRPSTSVHPPLPPTLITCHYLPVPVRQSPSAHRPAMALATIEMLRHHSGGQMSCAIDSRLSARATTFYVELHITTGYWILGNLGMRTSPSRVLSGQIARQGSRRQYKNKRTDPYGRALSTWHRLCLLLMLMRLDVSPKNSIDFGLILLFFVLEPVEHVWIKSKRYGFLLFGHSNLSPREEILVQLWNIGKIDVRVRHLFQSVPVSA